MTMKKSSCILVFMLVLCMILSCSALADSFDVAVTYDASAYGYGVVDGEVIGEVDADGSITISSVLYAGSEVISYLSEDSLTEIADIVAETLNAPTPFDVTVTYDASAYGYGVVDGEVIGEVDADGNITISSVLYAGSEVISYLSEDSLAEIADIVAETLNAPTPFDVTVTYDASAYGYGVVDGEVIGEVDADGNITISSVLYAGSEVISYLSEDSLAEIAVLVAEALEVTA